MMSAMRWVGFIVKRQTRPATPILAATRFGVFKPGVVFKFDAFGRGSPHGHTVTKPADAGSAAVTFNMVNVQKRRSALGPWRSRVRQATSRSLTRRRRLLLRPEPRLLDG